MSEANPEICAGCEAWSPHGLGCLQRTVPMGEGCRMARLQSLGESEQERTAGVPFVEDPDWRD